MTTGLHEYQYADHDFTEQEVRANREQWIKALKGESGRKFRQHRKGLASKQYKSFCCLGVACEAVPALKVRRLNQGDYTAEPGEFPRTISGSLDPGQEAALGLSRRMQSFLINLNDERRVPLNVIAVVVAQLPVRYPANSEFYVNFEEAEFEAEDEIVNAALRPYRKSCDDEG